MIYKNIWLFDNNNSIHISHPCNEKYSYNPVLDISNIFFNCRGNCYKILIATRKIHVEYFSKNYLSHTSFIAIDLCNLDMFFLVRSEYPNKFPHTGIVRGLIFINATLLLISFESNFHSTRHLSKNVNDLLGRKGFLYVMADLAIEY